MAVPGGVLIPPFEKKYSEPSATTPFEEQVKTTEVQFKTIELGFKTAELHFKITEIHFKTTEERIKKTTKLPQVALVDLEYSC